MPELPPDAVSRWLSPHRYDAYLLATGGNADDSIELYDWNATVAAACMRDIGHFEVLVRNRYAAELTLADPDWTNHRCQLWSLERGLPQTREKQGEANKKSRIALSQAASDGRRKTPGHIIANLSFGFWTALTLPAREATIWTPILSRVAPGATRGELHDHMGQLNHFRNRLAHWEPVFSTITGLSRRLSGLTSVFCRIDPAIAAGVGQRSTVPALLRSAPSSIDISEPENYLGVHA